jgi:predicted hydrocarbon binding protein
MKTSLIRKESKIKRAAGPKSNNTNNVNIYTCKTVHDVPNISSTLCNVVKLTKQLNKMS